MIDIGLSFAISSSHDKGVFSVDSVVIAGVIKFKGESVGISNIREERGGNVLKLTGGGIELLLLLVGGSDVVDKFTDFTLIVDGLFTLCVLVSETLCGVSGLEVSECIGELEAVGFSMVGVSLNWTCALVRLVGKVW